MSHYAIRSAESYLLKIDRGDAAGASRLGLSGTRAVLDATPTPRLTPPPRASRKEKTP